MIENATMAWKVSFVAASGVQLALVAIAMFPLRRKRREGTIGPIVTTILWIFLTWGITTVNAIWPVLVFLPDKAHLLPIFILVWVGFGLILFLGLLVGPVGMGWVGRYKGWYYPASKSK